MDARASLISYLGNGWPHGRDGQEAAVRCLIPLETPAQCSQEFSDLPCCLVPYAPSKLTLELPAKPGRFSMAYQKVISGA